MRLLFFIPKNKKIKIRNEKIATALMRSHNKIKKNKSMEQPHIPHIKKFWIDGAVNMDRF